MLVGFYLKFTNDVRSKPLGLLLATLKSVMSEQVGGNGAGGSSTEIDRCPMRHEADYAHLDLTSKIASHVIELFLVPSRFCSLSLVFSLILVSPIAP